MHTAQDATWKKDFPFFVLIGVTVFVIPFLFSSALIDPVLLPRFLVWSILLFVLTLLISIRSLKRPTCIDVTIVRRTIFLTITGYLLFSAVSLINAINITEAIFELMKLFLSVTFLYVATLAINRREDFDCYSGKVRGCQRNASLNNRNLPILLCSFRFNTWQLCDLCNNGSQESICIVFGCGRLRSEFHTRSALDAQKDKNWGLVISEINQADSFFYNMDPMSTPLPWHKGIANFSLGNIEEAFDDFKRAYEIHPNHIHVLNNLGTCYAVLGDYKRAAEYYQKALAISPGFDETLINLSAVYCHIGESRKTSGILRLSDDQQGTTVMDNRYTRHEY